MTCESSLSKHHVSVVPVLGSAVPTARMNGSSESVGSVGDAADDFAPERSRWKAELVNLLT